MDLISKASCVTRESMIIPPKIEERSSTILLVDDAFLMLEETPPEENVDFVPSVLPLFWNCVSNVVSLKKMKKRKSSENMHYKTTGFAKGFLVHIIEFYRLLTEELALGALLARVLKKDSRSLSFLC